MTIGPHGHPPFCIALAIKNTSGSSSGSIKFNSFNNNSLAWRRVSASSSIDAGVSSSSALAIPLGVGTQNCEGRQKAKSSNKSSASNFLTSSRRQIDGA